MTATEHQSEAAKSPRLGIIADGPLVEGWQFFMLQNVLSATRGAFVVFIEIHGTTPSRDAQQNVLARAIHAAERRWLARAMVAPLARKGVNIDRLLMPPRPLKELDAGAITVSIEAHDGADLQRALAARLDDRGIAFAQLDLLISLSSIAPERLFAKAPGRGVWALFCAGRHAAKADRFGIHDVFDNSVNSRVALGCWQDAQSGWQEVRSGRYPVFRWSWSLNARLLGHKCGWLLVDAVRLACSKPAHQRSDDACAAITIEPAALPATWQLVAGFVQVIARFAGEAAKRLTIEESWRILLWPQADLTALSSTAPHVLEPPRSSYWADPFVARQDGRLAIFFEEYLYAERRGVISYVEIDGAQHGAPTAPHSKRLMEEAHHLSYPYLFRHDGQLLMIPESSGARQVALWRCMEFPGVWEKLNVLLTDISAVDCSAVQWNGRWWLFTNIDRSDMADHCYELHLFFSDNLRAGTWRAHPDNPVVVDVTCARMAGGFLNAPDGRLVRICQVQGRNYGEGVTFRTITELSTTQYTERATPALDSPATGAYRKTHHFNVADGAAVADGCTDAWRLRRSLS